ncbi:histidine-rich protein PFHRP-II, partial [Plasmodium falciparum 7G8]
MVSFSKNKVLSAAVFASVLLLDNNNSAFNNNLCSKNAKGLNLNKRLLHETQAHVDDAHHAHHVADAHHATMQLMLTMQPHTMQPMLTMQPHTTKPPHIAYAI